MANPIEQEKAEIRMDTPVTNGETAPAGLSPVALIQKVTRLIRFDRELFPMVAEALTDALARKAEEESLDRFYNRLGVEFHNIGIIASACELYRLAFNRVNPDEISQAEGYTIPTKDVYAVSYMRTARAVFDSFPQELGDQQKKQYKEWMSDHGPSLAEARAYYTERLLETNPDLNSVDVVLGHARGLV